MDITVALKALAEALLIGTLVGAQREKFPGNHPGLRDFLAIALIGGVCGLLAMPWLSGVAFGAIALILAVYQYEHRDENRGITTELAAIAIFCLAYMVASPAAMAYQPLAVGSAIVVVLFLEARNLLHKVARESITDIEFNNTLVFVAIALVIYPLLPPGHFGPYQFFSPQQVWLFVVLVSSISYLGYFFRKFLGDELGVEITSLIGGLASTTAATLNFARLSRERPAQLENFFRATVIANTVQFPRTLFILYTVSSPMARACFPALAAMCLVSLAVAMYWTRLVRKGDGSSEPFQTGNPFRLIPGLKFGAMFAGILYVSKVAAAELGPQALVATSVLGGLVDVATVILSASELLQSGHMTTVTASWHVLLALGANIVLKLVLAASSGTKEFMLRMTLASGLTLVVGGIVAALTVK